MGQMPEIKLDLTAPIYADHLTPNGHLPRLHQVEASAAWHFTRLAMRILDEVPQQVTYEGQEDKSVSLKVIAQSVAKLYGLEDIGTMLTFMPAVRMEAFRCGYPWKDRLQAWVDSGGAQYDEVTREEKALNIQ